MAGIKGRGRGAGKRNRVYPLDIDQYQTNELRHEFQIELTSRKCKACKQPIYRKYELEICKYSNIVISKICIWDQYYTCCNECRREWLKSEDTNYLLGLSNRLGNGKLEKHNLKDPYLDKYYRSKKWGNSVHFSTKGRDNHNRRYREEQKNEKV